MIGYSKPEVNTEISLLPSCTNILPTNNGSNFCTFEKVAAIFNSDKNPKARMHFRECGLIKKSPLRSKGSREVKNQSAQIYSVKDDIVHN